MRVTLAVVALLCATLGPLPGQVTRPLDPGSRVRVRYDCAPVAAVSERPTTVACRTATGALVMLTQDTLVLTSRTSRLTIPLASLQALAVGQGRGRHVLLGAGIGFVLGSGAMFAWWSQSVGCDQTKSQDASSFSSCLGIAALLGGAPGALLGGMVGAFVRTDRWQSVPRDRLSLSLVPTGAARVRVVFTLRR